MALANKEIIAALAEKTLLELKELVDMMKEEFGVDPSAVAAAAPAAAAAGEAKKEEKPKDDGKTEEAAMEGLSSLFG